MVRTLKGSTENEQSSRKQQKAAKVFICVSSMSLMNLVTGVIAEKPPGTELLWQDEAEGMPSAVIIV